jgi:DnaJ family protein C protein 2
MFMRLLCLVLRCSFQVNITGDAAAVLIPGTNKTSSSSTPSSSTGTSRRSSTTGAPAAAAAADTSSSKSSSSTAAAVPNGAAQPAAASSDQPAAAAPAKPKKVVSADSGEWSEEQELALVQALKQFGKELPDRWERIAAIVPGKGKAACFKRFKELRDVFRAKKDGAA